MEKILKNITDIVRIYQNNEYKSLFELQKDLSCSMFFLKEMQISYNQEWNREYHNHSSKVNAVKQRHADITVPELYACRKLYEGANNVFLAIGREIKMN